ncbi:CTA4 [Candida metapsilosis]|uniref:CTA4 n=1 Tax=Candida metapsilosis TaxID=273372 RepID=A0A8H7ZFP1_9ASCO|nr:CTA4 [Candida metapsilosis]
MTENSVRKRNKPTFVCTNCKRKKIKCDRKTPCSSCVKLNIGYTCVYDTRWATSAKDGNHQKPHARVSSSNNQDKFEVAQLKAKVAELERIITEHHMKEDNDDKTEPRAPSVPVVKSNGATIYVRSQPIPPPETTLTPNPIVNPTDTLNFYAGYTPIYIKGSIRRVNFGPLTWIALLKRDHALSLAWKDLSTKGYFSSVNLRQMPLDPENIAIVNSQMNTPEGVSPNMDKFFRRKYLEIEGYDETMPYHTLTRIGVDNGKPRNDDQKNNANKHPDFKMSFTSISLARTVFEGRINPELQLIEKIKTILPSKKVFWSLIDLFFKNVYPLYPFIDEDSFKKELQKIVGKVDYEDKPFSKVNISKKLDLAVVALCFICLRMTYLSLYSNKDSTNREIVNSPGTSLLKFLFQNPINSSCIDVANSCIQCFHFRRKSNLTVFQAILYMRFYRNIAPEEGDGIDGGDSQVGTSLLIQMAISLGLNREPDLMDVCNDEKTNHLGRKIWAALMSADFIYCLSVGSPSSVHPSHYDVSEPFLNSKNSNIQDTEMESVITESFAVVQSDRDLVRKLLNYVLDIKNGVEMNKITHKLHLAEQIWQSRFNVMQNQQLRNDIDNSEHTRQDIKRFLYINKARKFLLIKIPIMSFYYHIYLHYEKMMDTELSFFYLSKIFLIIIHDIFPYIEDIINGYLSSAGLFLNPCVQLGLLKSNEMIFSCLVRVNFAIYQLESSENHSSKLSNDKHYNDHYEVLKNMSQSISDTRKLITLLLERIGLRYYCAWRISKSQLTICHTLSGKEFYEKNAQKLKRIRGFQFTAAQLDSFSALIGQLQKAVQKTLSFEDGRHTSTPDILNTDLADIQKSLSGTQNVIPEETPERQVNEFDGAGLNTIDRVNNELLEDWPNLNLNYIDHMWLQHAAFRNDTNSSLENNLISNGEDLRRLSSMTPGVVQNGLDVDGSLCGNNPTEGTSIQGSSNNLNQSQARPVIQPRQQSNPFIPLPSLFDNIQGQECIDFMLDAGLKYSYDSFL